MNGKMGMKTKEEAKKTARPANAKERNRKQQAVKLESQDDLGYLMGPHKAEDAQKQIKSPAPQPSEGEEQSEESQ